MAYFMTGLIRGSIKEHNQGLKATSLPLGDLGQRYA